MTNNYSSPELALRLKHLWHVVIKECDYLNYSAESLKQIDPQFRWLDAVDQHAEFAGKLDAFVSRFFRLQRYIS